MKNKTLLILILLSLPSVVTAQSYLINLYNGQTVTTNNGIFYDSGDSIGNYANDENYTVTFCSTTGILFINFTSVNIAMKDYLYVYDGPGTNYAVIKTLTYGSAPQTIYSSCGCLTFRFASDKLSNQTGWRGVIGTSASNDYIHNAITLPLNGTYLTAQSNIGATSDFSSGCVTSGNTVWYGFSTDVGNNTVDVFMQNATMGAVQYLLLYDYACTPTGQTSTVAAATCATSSDTVQFTGLTEGYYWLGVTSIIEGTFDIGATESYTDICGDYFCGPSESCNACPFDCGACPEAIGGPYFHPVVGIQNTYVGICMVNTCTGIYYDNGGISNPYNNSINSVYRTFCPGTPYSAIQASFNLLDIDYTATPSTCNDYLIVRNGPTQNSDIIWAGCGNSINKKIITLAGLYNSGIFQSTHTSGCLTFTFYSDAISNGTWEGWESELACVPNPLGPDSSYNNDCPKNLAICNDRTISSTVSGPGTSSEGCGSCVTSENFTEWYRFKVQTGGIMELELTPLGNSDMDFAIYKADACGEIGDPIRCSYAAYQPPGKTGLTVNSGDLSEGVSGDQWVAEMKINANEQYFLMINEWDKREPNAYTIDFKLSGGASFDCSEVLPVSFLDFYAVVNDGAVELIWKTASESNNAYFTVERSTDAFNFSPIVNIDGAGNSNEIIRYIYSDTDPVKGVAYYRIKQTDFDGKFDFSNVIAVDFLSNEEPWLNIYPNPSSDVVFISCDASMLEREYTIYNAAGAEVEFGLVSTTHFKLPVRDLDEGAYYFSVKGFSRHPFMVLRTED